MIAGEEGQIVLNGPPSRLFQKGDLVVILGFVVLSKGEKETHKTVFVDRQNKETEIYEEEINFK